MPGDDAAGGGEYESDGGRSVEADEAAATSAASVEGRAVKRHGNGVREKTADETVQLLRCFAFLREGDEELRGL